MNFYNSNIAKFLRIKFLEIKWPKPPEEAKQKEVKDCMGSWESLEQYLRDTVDSDGLYGSSSNKNSLRLISQYREIFDSPLNLPSVLCSIRKKSIELYPVAYLVDWVIKHDFSKLSKFELSYPVVEMLDKMYNGSLGDWECKDEMCDGVFSSKIIYKGKVEIDTALIRDATFTELEQHCLVNGWGYILKIKEGHNAKLKREAFNNSWKEANEHTS